MSTGKILYGAVTTITMDPGALASGSAWQSFRVDNTTLRYVDAELYVQLALAAGTPSGVKKRVNSTAPLPSRTSRRCVPLPGSLKPRVSKVKRGRKLTLPLSTDPEICQKVPGTPAGATGGACSRPESRRDRFSIWREF